MDYSRWDKLELEEEGECSSTDLVSQKFYCLKKFKFRIDDDFEKAKESGKTESYSDIIQQYLSISNELMIICKSVFKLDCFYLAISCLLNVAACYSQCCNWIQCNRTCKIILNNIEEYDNLLSCAKDVEIFRFLVHTYYFRAYSWLKYYSEDTRWNYFLLDMNELIYYRRKYCSALASDSCSTLKKSSSLSESAFSKLTHTLNLEKDVEIKKFSSMMQKHVTKLWETFESNDYNPEHNLDSKLLHLENLINRFSVISNICNLELFRVHYILAKVFETSKEYLKAAQCYKKAADIMRSTYLESTDSKTLTAAAESLLAFIYMFFYFKAVKLFLKECCLDESWSGLEILIKYEEYFQLNHVSDSYTLSELCKLDLLAKDGVLYHIANTQIQNEFLYICNSNQLPYCMKSLLLVVSLDFFHTIFNKYTSITNARIGLSQEASTDSNSFSYLQEFHQLIAYIYKWLITYDSVIDIVKIDTLRRTQTSNNEVVGSTKLEDILLKVLDSYGEYFAKSKQWNLADDTIRVLIEVVNTFLKVHSASFAIKSSPVILSLSKTDYCYRLINLKATSLNSLGHILLSKHKDKDQTVSTVCPDLALEVSSLWEQSAVLYGNLSDMRTASKVYTFSAKLLSDSINIKPFYGCLETTRTSSSRSKSITNPEFAETASYRYRCAAKCVINIEHSEDISRNLEYIQLMFMAGLCNLQNSNSDDDSYAIKIFENAKTCADSTVRKFVRKKTNSCEDSHNYRLTLESLLNEYKVMNGDISYHLACCYYRKGQYVYCLEESLKCDSIFIKVCNDDMLRQCKAKGILSLAYHAMGQQQEVNQHLLSLKQLYTLCTSELDKDKWQKICAKEFEHIQSLMRMSGRYIQSVVKLNVESTEQVNAIENQLSEYKIDNSVATFNKLKNKHIMTFYEYASNQLFQKGIKFYKRPYNFFILAFIMIAIVFPFLSLFM